MSYLTNKIYSVLQLLFPICQRTYFLYAICNKQYAMEVADGKVTNLKALKPTSYLEELFPIANCQSDFWKWRITDSNRWPPACKAGALASWANPPRNLASSYEL